MSTKPIHQMNTNERLTAAKEEIVASLDRYRLSAREMRALFNTLSIDARKAPRRINHG